MAFEFFPRVLLYIDPGTGSMLFTVLISIIGTLAYSLKALNMKIKFKVIGGKGEVNTEKIPFVIFSDDKRYWSIFEPICRELNKRGTDVVYLTSSEDDPALDNPYKHIKAEYIGKGTKAFARLNFLNATIVFSTTPGLDVYQWRRSKDVQCYVHIMHAAKDVTLYRMFGIDYYDAILLSGEYQIQDVRQMEYLRELPAKELVKVGVPYMDEMLNRLQQAGPVSEHPTTVLLAPSWGKSAIFAVYGGKIIEVLLTTGYHIIVRPHLQSFDSDKELIEKLMKEYPPSEQLEWNRDIDNFDVLRRSDILISDFSGIVFDFALIYDKPVIYANPDFDVSQYDAWWLRSPLWIISALERIGTELTEDNLSNLKVLIDSCLSDTSYTEGRRSVKAETWEYCGEGATRVADYLLHKYDELTHVEKED